jgi:glycosyltransferase involved in cell wall biosynthesis
MKRQGLEVHAVSSPGEALENFGQNEGVEVHGVEMPRAITPLRDLGAIRSICQVFREIRPHIVHSHTPKAGLLGTIAARISGVPVRIYHIHGLPLITATGVKRSLLGMSERTSSRLATQVLCVSNSVREVAVRDGLCPTDKVKVLLSGSINGIDSDGKFNPEDYPENLRIEVRERYGIPPEAVVIGFVGRIVRDKGVIELAEAWRRLRESNPGLHLVIVGAPEPQDPVPQDVEDALRSDPRVHMLGLQFDMPPIFRAMDMLVLPTYREGFPLVPMEAAAMGLPVVATRVPGCFDAVVDGVTGTLVPARNTEALAEVINCYVNSPELRKHHGLAGRARMRESFRQEDMWQAVFEEYKRLLALAGTGLPEPLPVGRD